MKISMQMDDNQLRSFSSEVHGEVKPFMAGEIIDLDKDTSIKLESYTEHRAIDVPSVLNFVVEAAATMEVGLITSWLYDKCMASGIDAIDIDDKKIEINAKAMEKALGNDLREMDKKT